MRDVGSKRISPACDAEAARPARTRIGEFGQREGIGQQADTRAAPNARERKLRRQRAGLLVLPDDRQRQQPARGTARRFGLDLRQQQLPVGRRGNATSEASRAACNA